MKISQITLAALATVGSVHGKEVTVNGKRANDYNMIKDRTYCKGMKSLMVAENADHCALLASFSDDCILSNAFVCDRDDTKECWCSCYTEQNGDPYCKNADTQVYDSNKAVYQYTSGNHYQKKIHLIQEDNLCNGETMIGFKAPDPNTCVNMIMSGLYNCKGNYFGYEAGAHYGGQCFCYQDEGNKDCASSRHAAGINTYYIGDEKPKTPSSFGDPHMKTWSGETYDFHGGCDLVLLQNPKFANGLGMHVHIRTSIHTWWSSIDSAVVQLGDDTLQVTGGIGSIICSINGEEKELETGDAALGDYAVHFRRVNDHQSQTRVDLGNHADAISIESFKQFVRVNIKDAKEESFDGSLGLLGQYPTGRMVGRDGTTIIKDANDFGQEWMVRPSDKILFSDVDAAQLPLQCAMPTEMQKKEGRARRLGEGSITEEEAALACARVSEEDRDACIFDVMATQDKDMAGSY